MALALAPLLLGRCRELEELEKPLKKCVLYRHKEDLPIDAAPFFDLYVEGQEPDTFRNIWLTDALPFRAPLFQSEGGIDGTTPNQRLTLEHQICLVAAADACDFLDPYQGANEHEGVSPLTAKSREYAPDISISQGRGPIYHERVPTYEDFAPRTQWEQDHQDGFWTGFAYEGKTEPGDYSPISRNHPWDPSVARKEAERPPFSLRAIDDYAEPADYKDARDSGAAVIGQDGTSCYEQCTWLRGKVATLWEQSGQGQDTECSAAKTWFESGCWYDGTPLFSNEHYEQRPVQQFQRQKSAAMFAACDWLGVGEVPDWILRDLQDVLDYPEDSDDAVLPRLRMPKPSVPWQNLAGAPDPKRQYKWKLPEREGADVYMDLQKDATRYDVVPRRSPPLPLPPSPPPPPPPFPPPPPDVSYYSLDMLLDWDARNATYGGDWVDASGHAHDGSMGLGESGLCEEKCPTSAARPGYWSHDGICDDGGPGYDYTLCPYGSDCADCGPRAGADVPPSIGVEGEMSYVRFEKRSYVPISGLSFADGQRHATLSAEVWFRTSFVGGPPRTTLPPNVACTTLTPIPQAYCFKHVGHCSDGWISPNTNQASVDACAAHCRAQSGCGFFAYRASGGHCALYTLSAGCPDDDLYPDYDAYYLDCPPSTTLTGKSQCCRSNDGRVNMQRHPCVFVVHPTEGAKCDVDTAASARGWDAYVQPCSSPFENWAMLDFDRSEHFNFFLRADNGRLAVGAPAANGYDYYETTGPSLADGEWHHAAFTLAAGGVLSIFRDGAPSTLNAQPGRDIGGGKKRYGFVGDGSVADTYNGKRNNIRFAGDIAQVRLHGGTLDPIMVRSNFVLTKCLFSIYGCGPEAFVPMRAFYGSAKGAPGVPVPYPCTGGENEPCDCTGTLYYGRKFRSGNSGETTTLDELTRISAYVSRTAVSGVTDCSNAELSDPLAGAVKWCYCAPTGAPTAAPLQELTKPCCAYGSDECRGYRDECALTCDRTAECAGATFQGCVDGAVAAKAGKPPVLPGKMARCWLYEGVSGELTPVGETSFDTWGYKRTSFSPPAAPPLPKPDTFEGSCGFAYEGDGRPMAIKCELGAVIEKVLFADYGMPWGGCGTMQSSWCSTSLAYDLVNRLCIGRRECDVTSLSGAQNNFNSLFADPCPGWQKWFKVEVVCGVPAFNLLGESVECDASEGNEQLEHVPKPGPDETAFDSMFACQEMCERREGCAAYSFDTSTTVCKTYTSCASSTTTTEGAGIFVFTRMAPPPVSGQTPSDANAQRQRLAENSQKSAALVAAKLRPAVLPLPRPRLPAMEEVQPRSSALGRGPLQALHHPHGAAPQPRPPRPMRDSPLHTEVLPLQQPAAPHTTTGTHTQSTLRKLAAAAGLVAASGANVTSLSASPTAGSAGSPAHSTVDSDRLTSRQAHKQAWGQAVQAAALLPSMTQQQQDGQEEEEEQQQQEPPHPKPPRDVSKPPRSAPLPATITPRNLPPLPVDGE